MQLRALTGLLPVLASLSGASWASPVVTEDELLSRLDRDHPSVVAVSGRLDLARSERIDALLLENPVFEIGREDPSGDAAQFEWLASWQLPGTGRSLQIEAADRSVDAATARAHQELRSLRSALRREYAGWALATMRHQWLDVESARLDTLTTRERQRAEKGESSGLEARRLELAATTLAAQATLAAADLRTARAAIAGFFPQLASDVQPELPPLPEVSDHESLAQEDPLATHLSEKYDLDDEHPQVSAQRNAAQAAELSLRASQKLRAGPELSLGWLSQEAMGQEESGPIFRLAWSVPIFDRRQAERAAAQARRDMAQADASIASQQIRAGRQSAALRLAELLTATVRAKSALDNSQHMLSSAETSFRYGELSLTDLLDIQRSMLDAQLAWLELHGAALAAERELETLAGTSNAPFLHLSTSTSEESTP